MRNAKPASTGGITGADSGHCRDIRSVTGSIEGKKLRWWNSDGSHVFKGEDHEKHKRNNNLA